jgi:thiamine pyrophosphate-dependent acetolactate synthase large subunit-like protein
LPIYDAVHDAEITHIQARHEQGAGHMAEGYAKASGRVGVAFATSGPGATNLVTPIADAIMDSVPTVFITGQVRTELIGTDGFQEADVNGITMPVVKHSLMVQDPRKIPEYVHSAFHIALWPAAQRLRRMRLGSVSPARMAGMRSQCSTKLAAAEKTSGSTFARWRTFEKNHSDE